MGYPIEGFLLFEVVQRLCAAYEHDNLGNFENPVDELIYIVLSSRTRGTVFQDTFRRLREQFPSWDEVTAAPLEDISSVLAPAGLSGKKARWLQLTLLEIKRRESVISLERLRGMEDQEAEDYLISLPGVGLKTARCVLMYSLKRQVFPVDANVRRLLERLELIPPGISYQDIHDRAQSLVPRELRADLHIYGVIHGRATCLPRTPGCVRCPLAALCPYPTRHGTNAPA